MGAQEKAITKTPGAAGLFRGKEVGGSQAAMEREGRVKEKVLGSRPELKPRPEYWQTQRATGQTSGGSRKGSRGQEPKAWQEEAGRPASGKRKREAGAKTAQAQLQGTKEGSGGPEEEGDS